MTRTPTVKTAEYALDKGEIIGSGAYRYVYKTKRSKWVYKVNKANSWGSHGNKEEYETYLSVKRKGSLPPGVKMPEMHLLENGVLAAEYIKGKHPQSSCSPRYHDFDNNCSELLGQGECWARKFADVNLYDIHCYNVIIGDDGYIYVIDLGHGEY